MDGKTGSAKGGDRRRIRKKRNKQAARVAFVTRGTAAITCQLWGHRSPRVPSTASQRAMGGSLFLFLFPPRGKRGTIDSLGLTGAPGGVLSVGHALPPSLVSRRFAVGVARWGHAYLDLVRRSLDIRSAGFSFLRLNEGLGVWFWGKGMSVWYVRGNGNKSNVVVGVMKFDGDFWYFWFVARLDVALQGFLIEWECFWDIGMFGW